MTLGKNKKPQLKVQVWIFCRSLGQAAFLLLKTTPQRGAFWQPVTGSVEEGEALEEAALREAIEETSLVFPGRPKAVGEVFEFESPRGPVRETSFALEIYSETGHFPGVKVDQHEHNDYRWMSADEALLSVRFSSNADVLNSLLIQLKKGEFL